MQFKFVAMQKFFLSIFLFLFCLSANAAEIFVSPQGNDKNSGTREQPMATPHAALRKARELRRLNDESVKNYVHIILMNGIYTLQEPIFIRPEDSGTESCPTIVKADEGAQPIISGGVPVAKWQKAGNVAGLPKSAQGKVWVADAPKVGGRNLEFRQLWVSGTKATRAQHVETENMPRILSWSVEDRMCAIPAPAQKLSSTDGVEMLIHQRWEIANLRVKSLDVVGDKALVSFQEPESRVQFEHPWPSPMIDEKNGNSVFMFINAIEFLDTPGEWYLDTKKAKVYYYPRQDEDMSKVSVVAPSLETLVTVEGSTDSPVSHIYFWGINFAHSTWMRPSLQGHVPLQAGMYMLDAYKLQKEGLPWDANLENQAWIGRQPAAVEVSNANNVRFQGCTFTHAAASAVDFVSGVENSRISESSFFDIGGSAIVAGSFQEGSTETHIPYNPDNKREICHHITIANNSISNVANEDWGCVGVSVGYAHDVNVEHNEVSDIPYSGICIGWGWTKHITVMKNNRIANNHVHHFAKKLYAAGGLYTLSAQPNTVISGNYVHDMVLSPYMQEPDYCYYIYLDGASSYIDVRDNWCPEQKFGVNNPGPGNNWENNGPMVSDEVKQKAGVKKLQ